MSVSAGSEQLYGRMAIVIEAGERPMLCVGAIRLVLPPRCGDVPIANWDWAPSPARSRCPGRPGASTTSWAPTTRSSPSPRRATERTYDEEIYRYDNPCPEPEGGWVVRDPNRSTQDHVGPARAYAKRQPDYVISWVDHLDEERQEFSPVVYGGLHR